MKSPVLVTGGAGFVGSNLVRALVKEADDVHLLVRPESDLFRLDDILSMITLHRVDLENLDAVRAVLDRVRPITIFHLAAHGVITQRREAKLFMSNILGTWNLLQASLSIPYEHFVHVGGSSEYGHKPYPTSEEDLLAPVTLYGVSKATSTLLSQQFFFEFDKPISILRLYSVYGPGESSKRLIPTLIRAAYSGEKVSLTVPGFSRDYIFVDDVVEACLRTAITKPKGEIFNIGTGVQTTNEEVVKLLETIIEKQIHVEMDSFPKRLSDTTFWQADNGKAKKILNWEPKHDLEQGLRKTIARFQPIFH